MNNFKPLKRFGQNYITDKNIIRKIITEFNHLPTDEILEIGPGRGALTEELVKNNPKISVVEIDTRVINNLKEKYPQIVIINKDFLELELSNLYNPGVQLKIIGNIPYNITSPIIFKLIESRFLVKEAVLMVQDEVAKRITASKDSKDYGILSVILNYFAKVKYCFKISPNVFYPKPKVNSAIIHIFFNKDFSGILNDELFIKVVKACFGNRRKTLKNSLSNSIFRHCDFSGITIDLKKRAEQLDIADFKKITEFIEQYGKFERK